jgi:hypothetical protein
MFQAVYESPLFHPVLFWIGGAAFVAALARRMPFLYGYLVVFALEILADATLTGPWSPVPGIKALATVVPLVFVILGDARYFVLVERARAGRLDARAIGVAAGLSLVVPITSWVPQLVWPAAFADSRHVFLLYELMFVALAAGMRAWLPQRLARAGDDDEARASARWAIRATEFELAQYALWAASDVLILAGFDAGFALRLLPNAMYYVLFLPFVAWSAPRALLEPWSRARA